MKKFIFYILFIVNLIVGCSRTDEPVSDNISLSKNNIEIITLSKLQKGNSFKVSRDLKVGSIIGVYTPDIPIKDVRSLQIVGNDNNRFKIDNEGYIRLVKPVEKCVDCQLLSVKIRDKRNRLYFQRLSFHFDDDVSHANSEIDSTNLEQNSTFGQISLKLFTKIEDMGEVKSFAMSDDRLFLGGDLGVGVYDKDLLSLKSDFKDLFYISDLVFVQNKKLLVANGFDGVLSLDLDDESHTLRESRLLDGGWASDIEYDKTKNLSYICNGSKGLYIISNEANSSKVLSAFDTFGYCKSLQLIDLQSKKYAIVADGYGGVSVIDLSIENNITKVSSIELDGWANSIVVSHNKSLAYVATNMQGVSVVDLNDLSNPIIKSIVDQNTSATFVEISDNDELLFTSSGDGVLSIYDLEDSNKPQLIQRYEISGIVNKMVYNSEEKKLYIATTKGFYIYEVE